MPHPLALAGLFALCLTPLTLPAQSPRFDLSQLNLSQLDLSRLDLSQLDLSQLDLSQLDPAAIAAGASDTLMRAPDASIDRLFQAVHRASAVPGDAAVLCGLFDPDADRSPQALGAAAQRLSEASRQSFGGALIDIAANGLQNPRQAYDPAAARQTLKAAGTTAMLLHDGFAAGLNADASDPQAGQARCRSLRWMLDALAEQPLARRAAATRLLLHEGLALSLPR